MEDPDWLVRKASAEALGHRGSCDIQVEVSRVALSRGLADEDPEVARAAAFGLARLGDPLAVPALMNFLERAQRDAEFISYETGQRALRALTHTRGSHSPREWRDWWRANSGALLRGRNR